MTDHDDPKTPRAQRIRVVETASLLLASDAATRFAASLLAALGHRRRIRILQTLAENGAMTVKELAKRLDAPQSNVSQHLAVLARSGALVRKEEGTARLYSVRDERLVEILRLVEEFRLEHRDDLAEGVDA